MKRLMIAFSAAALLLASAALSATAWAHGQGRGHHGHGPGVRYGHQFKPHHHRGFAHRPHFRPHFGHHYRPQRFIRRFHAPGHGARILIVPGYSWHARPPHDRRFRHGFGGGHRRSWR